MPREREKRKDTETPRRKSAAWQIARHVLLQRVVVERAARKDGRRGGRLRARPRRTIQIKRALRCFKRVRTRGVHRDTNGWKAAHAILVLAWLGLILGETVMEIAGRRDDRLKYAVARFHYLIDLAVEIPIVTGVLATGAVLMRDAEIDAARTLKIGLGLAAIAANVACFYVIIRRWQLTSTGDANDATGRAYSRWYFRLLLLGFPPGFAALVMGMRRAGWF